MKYDFTTIIDRTGKDAYAIDGLGGHKWGSEPDAPKDGVDFIPMWVADMNFATCPAIVDSIKSRLEHPLFGYFSTRDEYYDSIISWQTKRNGFVDLKKDYIGYENGVHGFVTSAINTLTIPGDKILVHTPYYTGFTMDIEGTGRKSVRSPLVLDENNVWRMDFEDMERKLQENDIHTVVFCSPHNPTGRVWERWELEKAMELFEKYECYVISDEIWADLTFSGHKHIPSLMVNEWSKNHVAAAYAPSKTFNLAGFVGSYHIIYNKYLRDRIESVSNACHYNEINLFNMYAIMGAYTKDGHEWVEELKLVLEENAKFAYNFILENLKDINVSMPQGTYMMFLDMSEYCARANKSLEEVLKMGWDAGVGWQAGSRFGGECHIRINLASPLSRIKKAFMVLKNLINDNHENAVY